jgi:hypothetical protein
VLIIQHNHKQDYQLVHLANSIALPATIAMPKNYELANLCTRTKRLPIDIILKNKLINGMYSLPCFALLVLLSASVKIIFKEQALIASTNKAGRLARQAGQQGS